MNSNENLLKQGEIYFFDFGEREKCEISGVRPAIIVQNNIGNYYSPNVTVVPLTSIKGNKKNKRTLPIHIEITKEDFETLQYNNFTESVVLCEQIATLSKSRIIHNVLFGKVKNYILKEIRNKICYQIAEL